ncbi:hypothetical protein EUGRSUZ_H02023 [Eucalyptus grandis]|uniref:Uncharacterized protein n=2 Tax=Eucalyptus grandis TaxID=71139 RepID=A0ACC3JQ13_EUCGR|nr:hypothetical protein EUGRSUZ_H02023 [Eucalyptus grandis]
MGSVRIGIALGLRESSRGGHKSANYIQPLSILTSPSSISNITISARQVHFQLYIYTHAYILDFFLLLLLTESNKLTCK